MRGTVSGVPPGRTGRLWLRRRLDTAQRGSELLDRRLQLLRREEDLVAARARQTAAEWAACCAEAEQWLLRAALLGGQRAVVLAASGTPTEVTVSFSVAAGVRYPVDAACVIAEPDTFDGAVLSQARRAFRGAVVAAARHAAAQSGLAIIDAEVAATRYRLRAIEDRWIPRLEQALAAVELGLDELEHADGVRLRQVLNRRQQG
jgi:V/A-type H+/Na+-transporting ATPase subunit D